MVTDNNKSEYRIRLGSKGPARVPTTEKALNITKTTVNVNVRKYPAEQRKFSSPYFDKLVKVGYGKVFLHAAWQAAPHMVPKINSKSRWLTTIDLRPVHATTKAEQRPMAIIEFKFGKFIGNRHFRSLELCSSYFQCPLELECYDTCDIRAIQGTFVSI